VLATRIRRARSALLVHDLYPEVLEVTGVLPAGGLVARSVRRMARWLYRGVDQVVVLGRDMAGLVSGYVDASRPRVTVIPNWGDVNEITPGPGKERPSGPAASGRRLRRAVAGQHGRTHALDALLASAAELRERRDIHFLLIGRGPGGHGSREKSGDSLSTT